MAQVWELYSPVAMFYVGVDLVQGLVSSSSAFHMLMELREHSFQLSMIKVPHNNMHSLRIFVLPAANGAIQKSEC